VLRSVAFQVHFCSVTREVITYRCCTTISDPAGIVSDIDRVFGEAEYDTCFLSDDMVTKLHLNKCPYPLTDARLAFISLLHALVRPPCGQWHICAVHCIILHFSRLNASPSVL